VASFRVVITRKLIREIIEMPLAEHDEFIETLQLDRLDKSRDCLQLCLLDCSKGSPDVIKEL